ncbi:MAG: FtsQ-type POTRA domain-containing protein [bacterium]|nr:FtsQ-type POTRA domain-containing protein [bacterium]MDD5354013.1 FtsQ-type POTRA domain-containing protein [bacterium]MDD5755918.1 FtsQ-type POTRA domain-containing protein [bacterium]
MPAKKIGKKRKWNSRVKKRRKQTLHFNNQLKKGALSIGAAVILLAAGWYGYQKLFFSLTNSKRCVLTRVEIKNLKYLSQHEILRLANIPCGVSIFTLPLEDIEGRIKSNPLVKKARVIRKWPSILVIHIQERDPVVKIIDQGQEYLLDSEARAIKNPLLHPVALPVLSGLSLHDIRLPLIINFLFSMRQQGLDLFQQAASFTMDTAKGLIVQLSSGLTLYWGELDNKMIAGNIHRLQQVQHDSENKGISLQYIDLRFKNVVIKPL